MIRGPCHGHLIQQSLDSPARGRGAAYHRYAYDVTDTAGLKRPDFFIVGAPKCGTTAMYSYLQAHPQVFMPFHKEPLYFGADLHRRYGQLSEGQYLHLFADARPDQRAGEASAWYLYSTSAAAEIEAFAPNADIVVMLRNPVDVMYAQHSQLLFNRTEDIVDFGEALEAEADRRAGRRLPPGPLRPENLFYRDMVRFADQLERYVARFGQDRVHVIVHDDLLADTPGEYRRLLRFLKVDPDFRPAFELKNTNKRPRFAGLQQLIYAPPGPLRKLGPQLRRSRLAHALRDAVVALNSRGEPRQEMDPALRARLTEDLRPDVERLGALIGRDLSSWSGVKVPS
ncbi:MAG TPA: sulfotransferase [Candidatus Limnocylindria bacterium]|nr:sulfotransferase [Candidatus Limnocylindria bacterium]